MFLWIKLFNNNILLLYVDTKVGRNETCTQKYIGQTRSPVRKKKLKHFCLKFSFETYKFENKYCILYERQDSKRANNFWCIITGLHSENTFQNNEAIIVVRMLFQNLQMIIFGTYPMFIFGKC